MKKLLLFLLLGITVVTLAGCNGGGDPDKDPYVDEYKRLIQNDCKGFGDYVVVDGVCYTLDSKISENISINGDETRVQYNNTVESMNAFVADLTGSKGLAVIPRDVFEAAINLGGATAYDLINLAADDPGDTSNLIVKLTEDGFFEEVGFTSENGVEVQITSNPLALEVYGAYTIVIFEVDLGYDNPNTDFSQKVYDSLYAGGIYLIHNESGKMFATKDVVQFENTYTYTEDHSRMLNLTVTLNEPVTYKEMMPVLDEFGKSTFDEFGNEIFSEMDVPLLDEEGNLVIFTEGPIMTEMLEVPVVNYFEVEVKDENGDVVLDELGNPLLEIIEEPVLDELGNPKIELQEVPVLDELGNLTFQQQFEVEIYLQLIKEITVTEYSASVTNNPLSMIAQKFVDKVISEYYNWNYYRVNNYMISSYGFATSDESIYYMNMKPSSNNTQENYVMKLSFDSETNEIILEEYINATKAGFDSCEIILDPRNGNVICDPWDGMSNIKVYSSTLGLKTITDSENLMPVTFPNGELYFYDSQQTFVEDLGYYTTALYNINSDGTLESHFIELGEKEQVCIGSCDNYINVDFYDGDGVKYQDYGYINLHLLSGDSMISNGDLTLVELSSFNSERPYCNDVNGCWGNTQTEILDMDGNQVALFDSYFNYFADEQVPYAVTYQLNAETVYQYEQQWSDIDRYCDNTIGCTSQVNLVDYSINEYGLWMYENIIVADGEKLIQRMEISETNVGVYDYTKTIDGEVCDYTTCDEYIQVRIFDAEGNLLSNYQNQVQVAQGETIPLFIDYTMSEDTVLTERTGVCTTSTGCWEYYTTPSGYYYYINYQQGDTVYETITFAETDKEVVVQQVLTSEVCTEVNGCYGYETEYIITDGAGNTVYTFNGYAHVEYGYTLPYKVTIALDDMTIEYKKESLTANAVCEDTTCRRQVEFSYGSESNSTQIGWGYMNFALGEDLVYRVILEDNTTISETNDMLCTYDEGCTIYTENFIVQDVDGNVFDTEFENWYTSVPVFFAKGEVIPSDSNFTATFELSNIEYLKERINIYDFMYNLNNVIILEDNLFLIERQQWSQGVDNFIITFDETTQNYSAKYTNISAVTEITEFNGGYIAINDDETAIINFVFNETVSSNDYYYFDVTDLTDGLSINGVNDLIVDYDGSIYFKGVDNFIQDITGSISDTGVVTIDVEIVEREVIRVRPIN